MNINRDKAQTNKIDLIWAGGIVVAIFILDLMVPLGVAIGILYVVPLVLTLRERKRVIWGSCFIITLLILLNAHSTSAAGVNWMAYANRGLSIFAIWFAGFIIVKLQIEQEVSHYLAVIKQEDVEKKYALESERLKTRLLATMSHEIRTPMNAIIGLTHLLQNTALTTEQAQQLDKVNDAAQHLLSIINNILEMSRIEAGKLTIENLDFQLGEVFDFAQSMLYGQTQTKGLVIKADWSGVPAALRGDVTRLRQALLNYVGNAVKFTEQGTISLSARKLDERGNRVLLRFEVKDQGIGIEADKLAKLFTVFEQGDVSTTRKYGGSGLGLAITRRLAEEMGGDAGVESEPGMGCTFWFTAWLEHAHSPLPASPTDEPKNAETTLRSNHSGSHILVVEDNDINREVAVALLNRVSLQVDSAGDGAEAVAKISENTYALVLMDIQMPTMDGLEATRVIRSMHDQESLPIIAMTANAFAEDRQACLAAGMNDFISKPVNPENLYLMISKWIR